MSKWSLTKGRLAGCLQDTGARRAALLLKDPAFLYGKIRELLPDSGVHPHPRPLFSDPQTGRWSLPQQGRASPPHASPILGWRRGSAAECQQDNSRVSSHHKDWEQPDWTTDDKHRSKQVWLGAQCSPKPRLCCSPDKGTASAPVRPQGPSPQLQGAPVRLPKTISERHQCHSHSAPSRMATGVHNHLQDALLIYVYDQRCEDDRFQFS